MSRKHYIAIAHILDANHADLGIVSDIADYFGEENPNFDRSKFIEAATQEFKKDLASATKRVEFEVNR